MSPYTIYLFYNNIPYFDITYIQLLYYISFGYFYSKIYNNYIENTINIYTIIHMFYLTILLYSNLFNKLDKLFLFTPYCMPICIESYILNKLIIKRLYILFGVFYNSILIILYFYLHEYFFLLLSMITLLGHIYYINLIK